MRIEHPHDGEPRAVAGAGDPHAAVVVRHVRQQPRDRVVRVGALVDRLCVFRIPRLAKHDERAVRLEAAADVLLHDYAAGGDEMRERRRDASRSQRTGAVQRAQQNDRQRLARLLRRVHLRIELHAIPHRDHRLDAGERRILRPALSEVEGPALSEVEGLSRAEDGTREARENQHSQVASGFPSAHLGTGSRTARYRPGKRTTTFSSGISIVGGSGVANGVHDSFSSCKLAIRLSMSKASNAYGSPSLPSGPFASPRGKWRCGWWAVRGL